MPWVPNSKADPQHVSQEPGAHAGVALTQNGGPGRSPARSTASGQWDRETERGACGSRTPGRALVENRTAGGSAACPHQVAAPCLPRT